MMFITKKIKKVCATILILIQMFVDAMFLRITVKEIGE